MKRLNFYFFLFLIILLGLTSLSESYQILDAPTSSINLQKILSGATFEGCRLKVGTKALCMCGAEAAVFEGRTSLRKFSQLTYHLGDVIDADISQSNTVFLYKSAEVKTIQLLYITGKETRAEPLIMEETPLLVRINSIETHSSVMIISRIDKSTFDLDTNTTNTVDEYLIDSFLFGPLPHVHHLKFPTQDQDFELHDSSFRDATIFHDPIFGNDYFIVALENGWLLFFKSFFEDPKLELLKTIKISTESDIKHIISSNNLLVVLLQNLSTRQLTLEIYRTIIPNAFDLRKECSFPFPEDDKISGHSPEIRVMKIENTFLISVNFPSSHLLVLTFQRPAIGIFALECPAQVQRINYSHAIKTVKIGYSFDYINTKYSDGTIEQGFLLSPFPNQYDHTYFFPYCMPNFYLNEYGFCELCSNSHSQGGFQTSCNPCDIANGKLIKDSNPLVQTCQTSCNAPNTFGRNCNETCESYLIAQRASLPPEGFAAINTKGLCSFQCKTGYTEETSGQCLKTEQEFSIVKNHCAQFNDCMNCTMTQSCSWCEGTCKSSQDCEVKTAAEWAITPDFLGITDKFLDRAARCDVMPPCSPATTKNTKDVFTFTPNTTYKNQVCKWHVQPPYNNYKSITVAFRTLQDWYNPPKVFMRYCATQLGLDFCYAISVHQDGKLIEANVNDIVFYAWVDESKVGNAHEFRLSYEISSAYNVLRDLFRISGLLLRFVVICIVFACFIFSYQRFVIHNRRRRLFRELQGIELVETNENEDVGTEIHVTEATENNRLITRATFESDSNEFEQNECPICLAEFKVGEGLAKLCCQHIFHVKCFYDWAQSIRRHNNVKCPVCNKILV